MNKTLFSGLRTLDYLIAYFSVIAHPVSFLSLCVTSTAVCRSGSKKKGFLMTSQPETNISWSS